jgi:large subunit ribosomal protein L2
MCLIKLKPTTPGRRHTILLKKDFLSKKIRPLKSALKPSSSSGGRNNQGILTVRTKGGGHKKRYRTLLFNRIDEKGYIESFEYCPFRNSSLARVYDSKKKKRFYVLAVKGLKLGDYICSGLSVDPVIGNALPLSVIPLGTQVSSIQLSKTTTFASAAGSFARILQKGSRFVTLQLPSGEQRLVPSDKKAVIGVVSNEDHKLVQLGKAGRKRWLGYRPIVRGVAKNPVDHPHGGGEGKTSGGRPSVSPWGKPAHGVPTSNSTNKLILVRRKKK